MRLEEKARRLTRVFYGLLLQKMFQSIAASSAPLFSSRASTRSDALFSASSFVASTESSRKEGWFGRASFKRSTIRDGCRQSAPFDRIVT
ncbi:hypothetical protein ACVIU4_007878 [Bradyrhizobium barranii subsp. barranii]